MSHKETVNKVDVYISNGEYKKLLNSVDFLPTFLYPYHHQTAPGELGRITLENGFTIYFHIKKIAINPDVILNLLEEIHAIGSAMPAHGIEKLKQVIRFLKENTCT